jgi:hypothetical protein
MFSYIVPTTIFHQNNQDNQNNDQLICISPSVTTIGQYTLDFNYRNETWITSRYIFLYYFTPVLFGGVNIPLKGFKNETDIYGEFFPESQIYFRIRFAGSSFILSGVRLSSSHIRCLKGSNSFTGKGLVKSFEVSFNGFDFTNIEINIISLESGLHEWKKVPIVLGNQNKAISVLPESVINVVSKSVICNGR